MMTMQRLLTVAVFFGAACTNNTDSNEPMLDMSSGDNHDMVPGIKIEFPGSTDVLADSYTGPKFKLSQDYPLTLPKVDPADLPWTKIDPKTQPDDYLFAVRSYIFRGLGFFDTQDKYLGDPGDLNHVKDWYNMPWLHVGSNRREGIHGFTRELDAFPMKLDPAQTDPQQEWGIGFFNALGGYTIGQVWKSHGMPNTADIRKDKAQYPEGTLIAKILFSAANTQQVPWLDGALKWQANVNSKLDRASDRAIGDVRLMQVDVAIKDQRAIVGWIFGTFVFDPTIEKDPVKLQKAGGTSPLHKMMPVGLMWGNDPTITPTDVMMGKKLAESYISNLIPDPAKKTLGWAGRLNGPGDNPVSSCLSCHGTAEFPPNSQMAPTGTEQMRLAWFQNRTGSEPFTSGKVALDFDLQMSAGLRGFMQSPGSSVLSDIVMAPPTVTGLPKSCPTETVDADKLFTGVVQSTCATDGCHGANNSKIFSITSAAEMKSKWVGVNSQQASKLPRVKGNDIDQSYIMYKLMSQQSKVQGQGGIMPLGAAMPLPDAQLCKFITWIKTGAN